MLFLLLLQCPECAGLDPDGSLQSLRLIVERIAAARGSQYGCCELLRGLEIALLCVSERQVQLRLPPRRSELQRPIEKLDRAIGILIYYQDEQAHAVEGHISAVVLVERGLIVFSRLVHHA